MLPKCKNEGKPVKLIVVMVVNTIIQLKKSVFLLSFLEEKHDIRKAILDCCLIRTPREESDDALESEEDE